MTPLHCLISQQDQELTIRALEFYIEGSNLDSTERMEANALLNWIRLQLAKSRYKNNSSK